MYMYYLASKQLVAESQRLGHKPWAAAPHLATARGAMPRIWPRAWHVEKSIEFEPKRPPQPSYEAIYATFALLGTSKVLSAADCKYATEMSNANRHHPLISASTCTSRLVSISGLAANVSLYSCLGMKPLCPQMTSLARCLS